MSQASCDKDIYLKGRLVMIINNMDNDEYEYLCNELSKELNLKIDWFYVGCCGVIKTLKNNVQHIQEYLLTNTKWLEWFDQRNIDDETLKDIMYTQN